MAISAGFTAVAGILIAYAIDGEFQAGKVGDGSITVVENAVLLLIVVVGGLGSIHGAILGAMSPTSAFALLWMCHQLRGHRPQPASWHSFTENWLTGVKTYEVSGFNDRVRLFFGGIAEYLAEVAVLGDILFGLLPIIILSYERQPVAHTRKSAAHF